MTEPRPPDPPRRRQRWLGRALQWALVVAVLALAAGYLAGLDWRDLGARIAGAEPLWLSAAAACLLLRWVVWAQRWRLAALALGAAPGVGRLFLMVIASAALNHLTPAARVLGGLLRARYLARYTPDRSLGQAFGSVLFDQLVHQVAIAGATVLGLATAAWSLGRYGMAAGSAATLAVLGGGLALLWLRLRAGGGQRLAAFARRLAERAHRRSATALGTRAGRVLDHGREAVGVVRRLLGSGWLIARTLTLGVAYALVNAAALWAVFRGLGDEVGFAVALAAVALGVAAGTAAGTPGGLGATEAAIIASLAGLGVDQVAATAGALLYRGLHYLTVFAVGLPSLAALELGRRRRRRGEAPPEAASE